MEGMIRGTFVQEGLSPSRQYISISLSLYLSFSLSFSLRNEMQVMQHQTLSPSVFLLEMFDFLQNQREPIAFKKLAKDRLPLAEMGLLLSFPVSI